MDVVMEKWTDVRWFIRKRKQKHSNNVNQRSVVMMAGWIDIVGTSVYMSLPSASRRACLDGLPWGTLVNQLTREKKKKNVSGCWRERVKPTMVASSSGTQHAGTRSDIYELSRGDKRRWNPYYCLNTKPPGCAWDMLSRGLLFITISCETEKET